MVVYTRAICPSAIHGVPKKTIVALLGWAGARDQHLSKYAKIYEERGIDTVRYIADVPLMPVDQSLKNSRDVTDLANFFKNYLKDPTKEVVIHGFSMNSVYTICSLHLQYPDLNFFSRTKGILFDSAPIKFEMADIIRYGQVLNFVKNEKLENASIWNRVKFNFSKQIALMNVSKEIISNKVFGVDENSAIGVYKFLSRLVDLPKHMGFLYSFKDSICTYNSIQEFHEKLSQRDFIVDYKCFENSEHVMHYRTYPTEYIEFIENFLRRIYEHKSKI